MVDSLETSGQTTLNILGDIVTWQGTAYVALKYRRSQNLFRPIQM